MLTNDTYFKVLSFIYLVIHSASLFYCLGLTEKPVIHTIGACCHVSLMKCTFSAEEYLWI